jgi:WD40 repeat protein
MLQKSNILALVGGGTFPKFSKNKIIIWDDHQEKVLSQIRLNSNLITVKIRRDVIIGIITNKIYIFDINTLETIDIINNGTSPNGICALSQNYNPPNEFYLAFPNDKVKGKVQINKYMIEKENINKKDEKAIIAHDSFIAQMIISYDNQILATTSDKGKMIRIFSVKTGEFLVELKRGATNANISCLAFDIKQLFLGCFSDSGTVHVFDIGDINKLILEKNNGNKKNNSKIKIKERSFAKFKLKEEKSILGFGQDNSIIIITSQAVYYRAGFDVKTDGNCTKIEEHLIKGFDA